MAKALKRIGFAVLILAALEVCARLYLFCGIPQTHRPAGVAAQLRLFFGGGSYTGEFRGKRYLFQKPANVYRILTLGGSTTAGITGDTETWPHHLETELNSADPAARRYEVINLGQCGAASAQEYFYLVSHAYLDPDLVILYDGYNDLTYANARSSNYLLSAKKTYQMLDSPGSWRWGSVLYRHLALVNRLDVYLYRLKNKLNESILLNKWFGVGAQKHTRLFSNVEWYASHFTLSTELERIREVDEVEFRIHDLTLRYDVRALTGQDSGKDLFPELYRYNLENIASFLERKKIRGLFVFQPFLSEKITRLSGGLNAADLKGLSNFNIESDRHLVKQSAARKGIMRAAAEKHGHLFHDAQDVFDGEPNADVYRDNCHNTDQGLRILAGRIRKALPVLSVVSSRSRAATAHS